MGIPSPSRVALVALMGLTLLVSALGSPLTGSGFPFENCKIDNTISRWFPTLKYYIEDEQEGSSICWTLNTKPFSQCVPSDTRCCQEIPLNKFKMFISPSCQRSDIYNITLNKAITQAVFKEVLHGKANQATMKITDMHIPFANVQGSVLCFNLKGRDKGGNCPTLKEWANEETQARGLFEIGLYDVKQGYECCPIFAFPIPGMSVRPVPSTPSRSPPAPGWPDAPDEPAEPNSPPPPRRSPPPPLRRSPPPPQPDEPSSPPTPDTPPRRRRVKSPPPSEPETPPASPPPGEPPSPCTARGRNKCSPPPPGETPGSPAPGGGGRRRRNRPPPPPPALPSSSPTNCGRNGRKCKSPATRAVGSGGEVAPEVALPVVSPSPPPPVAVPSPSPPPPPPVVVNSPPPPVQAAVVTPSPPAYDPSTVDTGPATFVSSATNGQWRYDFFRGARSFSGAEAFCNARGGHLVSIPDAASQAAVEAAFRSSAPSWGAGGADGSVDLWMGLRSDLLQRRLWTDGGLMAYMPQGFDSQQLTAGACYSLRCGVAYSGCTWLAANPASPALGCSMPLEGFMCQTDAYKVLFAYSSPSRGSSYVFTRLRSAYSDAAGFCSGLGGYLWSANSEQENTEVLTALYSASQQYTSLDLDASSQLKLWLGLNFKTSFDDTTWADGTKVTFNAGNAVTPSRPGACYAAGCDKSPGAAMFCYWAPQPSCGDALPGFICEIPSSAAVVYQRKKRQLRDTA